MKFLALVLAIVAAVVPQGGGGPAQQAAQTERVVVWAVGDAAAQVPGARRLAAAIRRARPDRFLYLGDVYEYGTAGEFRRNYEPLYGSLAGLTEPTPGNHEWANRHSGYYPYWRAKKGRRQRPWSRVQLAGWELLSLNSEAAHGPGSRQLRWLQRVVSTGSDCRIAFWHRPRFSAGLVHGDAPDMAPLWNALRGRARAVLSGHEHDLQRLRPRGGLTQYVAGAGGRSRYPLSRTDPRLAWGRDDRDGALKIVLEPGSATFEFRDAAGRLLDRSRTTCGGSGSRPRP
jgi:Calcineurin-like phosphoesterase